MDDIASEMHISKKTIYSHFNNKTELVKASSFQMFDAISKGIKCISCQPNFGNELQTSIETT